MMGNDRTQSDSEQAAWEAHSLSQLLYFRSLSLREKIQAVQGMADVVRRFEEMRANGEFHVLADGRHPDSGPASQSAREPATSFTRVPREDKSR